MLELKNISKVYGEKETKFYALKNINVSFPDSQFCCILGPSGSGKSTLLNIIGGLDRYTEGDLIIDGVSTKEFKSNDWDNYRSKKIGFVFQHYNLVNHLTVYENLEIALKIDGYERSKRRAKCDEVLAKVGLSGQGHKYPTEMSGGQQQRVSIARALINDPDIILADEPTGALDSKSSVVVLEILKEVAKTKLIIMVTHNEELANKYATRIIRIHDGEINSDTNIHEGSTEKPETSSIFGKKKSKMNFWTCLHMSFRNLMTKKIRTVFTCLGCSFGVVGVALVLALSNGVTGYIGRIESEAAGMLPLTIYSSSTTSEVVNADDMNEQYPDDDMLRPFIAQMATTGEVKINYLSEKYINYLNYIKDTTDYMNDFFVQRDSAYSYNLVTEFPDGSFQMINNSASIDSEVLNQITSMVSMPNTPFHALAGREEYVTQTYEVIYGEYPSTDNPYEVVLVVDQYNSIPLGTLQALGIYDSSYQDPIEANKHPISFEDILGKKYKIFTNDELYHVEQKTTVVDRKGFSREIISANEKSLETAFNSDLGHEVEIVGVLRPREGVTLPGLGTGLCYQQSLADLMVEQNDQSELTKHSLTNYSLKKYVNFSDFRSEMYDLMTSMDMNTVLSDLSNAVVLITQFNRLFNKYFDFYSLFSGSILPNGVTDYVNELKVVGADINSYELLENGIENTFLDMLTAYEKGDINEFYDAVINIICYLNQYNKIQSILIYPASLESKQNIIELLDEYNVVSDNPNDPYHATSENEKVYYTDLVSMITGALSQMINVVSIVLVLFSSISLIVSCILTAIITYSSVIERTREIGILRSLGARKGDVGTLFIAESVLVSTIASIIGCFVSFLAAFQLNYFLNLMFPEYFLGNIVSMTWWHCILLFCISIVIGFISGLIPSKIAANKDPVKCLMND